LTGWNGLHVTQCRRQGIGHSALMLLARRNWLHKLMAYHQLVRGAYDLIKRPNCDDCKAAVTIVRIERRSRHAKGGSWSALVAAALKACLQKLPCASKVGVALKKKSGLTARQRTILT